MPQTTLETFADQYSNRSECRPNPDSYLAEHSAMSTFSRWTWWIPRHDTTSYLSIWHLLDTWPHPIRPKERWTKTGTSHNSRNTYTWELTARIAANRNSRLHSALEIFPPNPESRNWNFPTHRTHDEIPSWCRQGAVPSNPQHLADSVPPDLDSGPRKTWTNRTAFSGAADCRTNTASALPYKHLLAPLGWCLAVCGCSGTGEPLRRMNYLGGSGYRDW